MNFSSDYPVRKKDTKIPDRYLSNEIMEDPIKFIPFGAYCYHFSEELASDVLHIYPKASKKFKKKYPNSHGLFVCPFWKRLTKKTGFCYFIGKSDKDLGVNSLSERIKVCDVKADYQPLFKLYINEKNNNLMCDNTVLFYNIFEKLCIKMSRLTHDEIKIKNLVDEIVAFLKKNNIVLLHSENIVMEMIDYIMPKLGFIRLSCEHLKDEFKKFLWSFLSRTIQLDQKRLENIATSLINIINSEGVVIQGESVLSKMLMDKTFKTIPESIFEDLAIESLYFFHKRGVF